QRAGNQAHAPQVAQLAGEQQVKQNDGAGKDQANQALGQNVQRGGCGQAPAGQARGRTLFLSLQEEVEAQGQPQSNQHVRNLKTGVDINAEAGAQRQGGI